MCHHHLYLSLSVFLSSLIISPLSPILPPQLESIMPPKHNKPATRHGDGPPAKSMKRTAAAKSPPSSAKPRHSDQYAKKYPTRQRGDSRNDTTDSVTSPSTTMANPTNLLTTPPATQNDSSVASQSGSFTPNTTSPAKKRSSSMLQTIFNKTKSIGASIISGSFSAKNDEINNSQSGMSVAQGGLNNNNDDSDDSDETCNATKETKIARK